LFCFISYFAIILDCVHLRRRATSAPDTNSASLLIFFLFFVATLCVNKDVYIKNKWPGTRHRRKVCYTY